jgi:hypothetical protein
LVANSTSSGTPAACRRSGHRSRTGARTAPGRSRRAPYRWRTPGRRRPGRSRCGRQCRCTGAAPHRGGAFLEVASLIDDQHRLGVAQVLDHIGAHVVANRILIPHCPGEQVLPSPSGLGSPACSASVQQFLRGRSASSPRTNALARCRGSTLARTGPQPDPAARRTAPASGQGRRLGCGRRPPSDLRLSSQHRIITGGRLVCPPRRDRLTSRVTKQKGPPV